MHDNPIFTIQQMMIGKRMCQFIVGKIGECS